MVSDDGLIMINAHAQQDRQHLKYYLDSAEAIEQFYENSLSRR